MDTEQVPLPTEPQAGRYYFLHPLCGAGGLYSTGGLRLIYSTRGLFCPEDREQERCQLVRTIGRLNTAGWQGLFICVGPGRWGSSNSDLGVPIDYGDIYNTRSWWSCPAGDWAGSRSLRWGRISSRTCWRRKSTRWRYRWMTRIGLQPGILLQVAQPRGGITAGGRTHPRQPAPVEGERLPQGPFCAGGDER